MPSLAAFWFIKATQFSTDPAAAFASATAPSLADTVATPSSSSPTVS
jgi:hypothetical protein